MKKTFTILTFTVLSVIAFAEPLAQSKLGITTIGNRDYRIILDGSWLNITRSAEGEIMIINIRSGNHNIKIYQLINNRNYKHRNNRSAAQQKLLYVGNVFVKPQYHVYITVNRFGKTFVDEECLENRNTGYSEGRNNGSYNNGAFNNKASMNARDFSVLKQAIDNERYEASRLNVSKQAITSSYFYVSQVIEWMQLVNIENNKLDLAKYAYRFSSEPGNYYKVVNELSYAGSREELNRYILQNR